tara:strand:- start:120 stop:551 length:432 start_codon:yes stop_codon:yes gene_type:complete
MANNIPALESTDLRYFYFRTVSSLATDDGDVSNDAGTEDATSLIIPVSAFRGVSPISDNIVQVFFKPVIRIDDRGADSFKNSDSVKLNIGTNEGKKVMKAICDAASGQSFRTASMIVVADDVTTTYLPGITSCADITVNVAYA